MKDGIFNGKNYTISVLDEFFEDCAVAKVDEFFSQLDKENQKRSNMVSKSLSNYLQRKSGKYDILRKSRVNA